VKKNFLYQFFSEKFRNNDKQLELQAKEYERRLAALNHEADQLKDMQSRNTPREVFDRTMDEMRKELKIINDWKTKQDGKSDLTKYIPWIIAAASLYLAYFGK
jgi:hypothetical protein